MSDTLGSADILKRLRVLGLSGPMERVLACQWGRGVATEEDPGPCVEQAVRITVLHAGDEEQHFRFCQPHTDYVAALTTPHEEGP